MHVLVLPSWFEEIKNPTSGSFFKDQATALAIRGHQVGIIFPSAISLRSFWHWRPVKIHLDAVNKLTIYTSSYYTIPKRRQRNIDARLRAYEGLFLDYIKRFGTPDILHAHSCALGPFGSAGQAANIIAKKYRIPYIITEHASAFHDGYYRASDIPHMQSAFQEAEAVLAVSQALRHDLVNFGIKKEIQVLGNVICTSTFKKASEQFPPSDHFTFVTIAYLRPIKRIDLILHAFSIAIAANRLLHLKIIGSGRQLKQLQQLTTRLGLQNAVEFLGELPRADVAKQIDHSNCYILSSTYETFSVACHEALAAGKPVISTPCGGPEATLKTLNEKLLDNASADSLATAMIEMANQEQVPSKITYRQDFVACHFSAEVIGKVLEKTLSKSIKTFNAASGQTL
ncbi:glycosyltransferase [Paraglaciecola sp.]|uniref:glycosyltransferase n=1 Tax=Paraglaciecola sp. TaxID=1920173 RepID=UPI0030F46EEF